MADMSEESLDQVVSADGGSGQASSSDREAVERLTAGYGRLKDELARVIVGQDDVVDQLLVAILSNGHVILEGVPGLAKTLMI